MATSPEPILIAVHGLPQLGVDPVTQLEPIRAFLSARRPEWSNSFIHLRWASAGFRDVTDTRKLLASGTLAATVAERLDRPLRELLSADREVVIVSFSAGGFAVYRWLAETAEDTTRVALVAIASPHQCREGGFIFEEDPHQRVIPFKDPPIPPQRIAAKLSPSRLLVLLLGEHDGTVLRHNAEFPQELMDSGLVAQHVIPGATHQTICYDGGTHRHLAQFLHMLRR